MPARRVPQQAHTLWSRGLVFPLVAFGVIAVKLAIVPLPGRLPRSNVESGALFGRSLLKKGRSCLKSVVASAFPTTEPGPKLIHRHGSVAVERLLGTGSYGKVFAATWHRHGKLDEKVAVKQVQETVCGAREMARAEQYFASYIAQMCPRVSPEFLGYFDVSETDVQKVATVTEGRWLMWNFEGSLTLEKLLKEKNAAFIIGDRFGDGDSIAGVRNLFRELLEQLSVLHSVGIVHRDIKPSNILLPDITPGPKVKLIDLGACVDLRNTFFNYVPDETIIDPRYSPPEEYVLPSNVPNLAKHPEVVAKAQASMLWNMYGPGQFDSFSAGLVFMQLAIPSLRDPTALQKFRSELSRAKYDIYRWRRTFWGGYGKKKIEVLDVDKGAGWDLAAGLLRQRGGNWVKDSRRRVEGTAPLEWLRIAVDMVGQPNDPPRLSPEEALNHPYFGEGDIKELRR